MPVNNQPPIGMITVKVTAPMISSVTAEVRIISRLAGMTRRTWRSTHAPRMAAISTPMILPRGSMLWPKKVEIPA